jgi:hypothetical protein
VQDADQALASLLRASLCSSPLASWDRGTHGAPGETRSVAKASLISASMSRSLRTYRAATIFFLPEARVIWEVPA